MSTYMINRTWGHFSSGLFIYMQGGHQMKNREKGGKLFQNNLSFDQFRALRQEYSQSLGRKFDITAAKDQIKSE